MKAVAQFSIFVIAGSIALMMIPVVNSGVPVA